MQRNLIAWACCITVVLTLTSCSASEDVELDFLETLMRDGKYPTHFFAHRKEAAARKAEERAANRVTPLYDQEQELFDASIHEEFDYSPPSLYNQESELFDQSLMQDKSDFSPTKAQAKKMMKTVNKWLTPGSRKLAVVKGVKGLDSKRKALKAMMAKAKAEIVDAVTTTERIAGHGARKQTPKQMVKNVMYLKAFATLIRRETDAVWDEAKSHLGALGKLLFDIAESSKLSPVAQYTATILKLSDDYQTGMAKYTLASVAKAMCGNGLISLGPVANKNGNFVRIDGKDLGLLDGYPLLGKLSAFVGSFTKEVRSLSKSISGKLKGAIPEGITRKEYERLFRATCYGAGAAFGKCQIRDQAMCGKLKTSKGHSVCKWIGAWDGKIAQVVQMRFDQLDI